MKYLTYVLIGLGLLVGAYVLGTSQSKTITLTKEVVKEVEKVVYKDKVVYKEKKVAVDGSYVEREISRDVAVKGEKTRSSEKVLEASSKPTYSLGLSYRFSRLEDMISPSQRNLEIQAARRIVGDLWGTVTGSRDGVSLGVRVDF